MVGKERALAPAETNDISMIFSLLSNEKNTCKQRKSEKNISVVAQKKSGHYDNPPNNLQQRS
jgi:hypothetical protein